MPAEIEFNPFSMEKGTAPAGCRNGAGFFPWSSCLPCPERRWTPPAESERWISSLEVPSSVPAAHWNSFLLHTQGNWIASLLCTDSSFKGCRMKFRSLGSDLHFCSPLEELPMCKRGLLWSAAEMKVRSFRIWAPFLQPFQEFRSICEGVAERELTFQISKGCLQW